MHVERDSQKKILIATKAKCEENRHPGRKELEQILGPKFI